MKSMPIDPSRVTLAFLDAAAVPLRDRDTRQVVPGRQAADEDGVPVWFVNCLAMVQDIDGGETIKIRVPSDEKPAFAPLTRVALEGLIARPWDMDGRSGISFSATAIRVASDTPNGTGSRTGAKAAVSATAGAEG
jgi:hypothetical protein